MHHTKEDAIRLGVLAETKHRQTRRAYWKKYWRKGVYGITIHMNDKLPETLDALSVLEGSSYDGAFRDITNTKHPFGEVEGNINIYPQTTDFETHLDRQPAVQRLSGSEAYRATTSLSAVNSTPRTTLTTIGAIIDRKICEIGTHRYEENVTVTHHCVMPTHIHMIVEVRECLPYHTVKGKKVRWTLSDIIGNFEKGCTSWYYRWLEGESFEEILANPSRRRESKEPPQGAGSLWNEEGFNDRILYTPEMLMNWQKYVSMNAYYWLLEIVFPDLFKHEQHIIVAGTDYSSYGCMFLLRKDNRIQVQCTRLATKGMLKPEEWAEFSKPERARQFEADRAKDRLARYDYNWLTSADPDCKTPIPYHITQAFQKQKRPIMKACEEEHAVLVSPAVSPGEKDIFYDALEKGYPCIKLAKDPFDEHDHAFNYERSYCAKAQLLVLGPWEIHGTHTFNKDDQSLWEKFHNLNDMAAELCKEFENMTIDRKQLEKH